MSTGDAARPPGGPGLIGPRARSGPAAAAAGQPARPAHSWMRGQLSSAVAFSAASDRPSTTRSLTRGSTTW